MTIQVLQSVGRERVEARTSEALDEFPRYRVDVVAPNVAETVQSVGGWVFDMAMAGWDVRVLVPGDVDDRPLRILGARTVGQPTSMGPADVPPDIIAVHGDFIARGSRGRDDVLAAIDFRGTEVMMWGTVWPPESTGPWEHRLSVAARVFKAQALTAAKTSKTSCEQAEEFWSYRSTVPQSSTWTRSSADPRLLATGSDPLTARPQAIV